METQTSTATIKKSKRRRISLQRSWSLGALLLMGIVFGISNSNFFGLFNLMNIARQVSVITILATGMTYVIITAGIDLSMGSVIALSSCLAAGAMHSTGSGLVGLVVGLGVGLLCGLFNGMLIAWVKIPPFVATLAAMAITRSLALVYTQGRPITRLPASFRVIGAGDILGVPVPIIIGALIVAAGYLILRHTKYGLYVYAIGGNERASYLSGINLARTKIVTYCISGLLAAFSGLILIARLNSAQPTLGSGYELEAVAAAVIGGCSLAGGQGNVIGTVIGASLMGVLDNGLNLMHVSSYWQQAARGVVILLAVIIDRVGRKEA